MALHDRHNCNLNVIARRPRRALPIGHGPPSDGHEPPGMPLSESVWVEPYPDRTLPAALAGTAASPDARYEQRESVELAFVTAIQHCPRCSERC